MRKFNETLPKKEQFYSNLNMEIITDADYLPVKRVCNSFETKNLGKYHDLYLKSNTLIFTDVFENFRKMCLDIYHLEPSKFLSAPGLAWQAALKKKKVKLVLLTDIDMLLMVEKEIRSGMCNSLMVEKGIRGGICNSVNRYVKANNKYMKDYDKNKKSSYLKYWNKNNLYGWAVSQKFFVNDFHWVEDIPEFNENFIKSSNEDNGEGYFLEVDIQYPENKITFRVVYHLY